MSVITGLNNYWPHDEASGNALDVHGSRPLTDETGVASTTGKVGNARDFEASSNDRMSSADNADLSMGDIDFEFALWLKPESLVSFPGVFGKYAASDATDEYLLYSDGSIFKWVVWNPSSTATTVSSTFGTLSTATWYFVTCGYDSALDLAFMTVNAGTPDTQPHAGGVRDGTNTFYTGAFLATRWDGLIDEFGLWKNRVLTPAERTWLYNAGAGRSYADLVAEAAPTTPDPVMSRGRRWNVQRRRNVFRSRAA